MAELTQADLDKLGGKIDSLITQVARLEAYQTSGGNLNLTIATLGVTRES